ncbi:PAS domain-containing sensor histidine kinase [Pacificimonas flava]|uniref:histidine kinase n=2 Tax=Pacificimonas TaxID=1960290 RepID=A0A219B3V1_9SPHN|nr:MULTISPECIES: PAS domain-containing sensor histidine kinase [Pacificimonas]MBZ6377245.1 PAS domain-containing sensor histidine kinase [Pacificimonas aurantium]OWV33040.1 PAS domain-containing sensor histidine kinase [Pacificimonas flava]
MSQDTREASLTWRVTPDLMCVLDLEGRFVALNPSWSAALGWTRAEMLGAAYTKFLHPDDIERSEEAFAQAVHGDPVLRLENRYRTSTGDYRWLSWVAVPEGDRLVCTVRDVTDHKARAEIIEDQQVEADLREQFLAILGHDLRNPVAAMTSGLSVLERRIDDEKLMDVVRQMRLSADRASELIDNMMDFARVRLGDGIGLNQVETNGLNDSIAQVVHEVALVNPEFRFETELDLDETVRCDVSRLTEVVSNLLGNAVTHGSADEPVRVAAKVDGERLRISVCNAGPPIPEETREMLFQPFFRAQVRSSQQGLGLGLYISNEIAKAHGGWLEVASDESETRFTINIPA